MRFEAAFRIGAGLIGGNHGINWFALKFIFAVRQRRIEGLGKGKSFIQGSLLPEIVLQVFKLAVIIASAFLFLIE